MLLLNALCGQEEKLLELPNGELVRFYQLFPLYEEEMNEKIANGTEALLKYFETGEISPVIALQRRNVCSS